MTRRCGYGTLTRENTEKLSRDTQAMSGVSRSALMEKHSQRGVGTTPRVYGTLTLENSKKYSRDTEAVSIV